MSYHGLLSLKWYPDSSLESQAGGGQQSGSHGNVPWLVGSRLRRGPGLQDNEQIPKNSGGRGNTRCVATSTVSMFSPWMRQGKIVFFNHELFFQVFPLKVFLACWNELAVVPVLCLGASPMLGGIQECRKPSRPEVARGPPPLPQALGCVPGAQNPGPPRREAGPLGSLGR